MSLHPATIWPARASRWKLRTKEFEFGHAPLIMGIVNVTPDSFSDGGTCFRPEQAVDHALQLVAEGASLIDVGGESTRPYATPVSSEDELRRVVPVLEKLVPQTSVPISIDTSKSQVARAALDLGVEIINDVTGLEGDAEMPQLARESGVGICAMHMRGTPQTMQDDPRYDDLIVDIFDYLRQRRDALLQAGLQRDQICLDPGVGFGKTHQHNVDLIAGCGKFHELGCPLLVGHSRKGFIGKLLGDPDLPRIHGSIGAGLAAARQGVQVLRVHDVAPLAQALRLFEACGGLS